MSEYEKKVLEISKVSKKYGDFNALKDISFCINQGDIVGLLGHNGAGKSTLIKCIMGAIQSYTGDISYEGNSILMYREPFVKDVGILLEPAFVEYLSGEENLKLLAISMGKKYNQGKINELLEMVSLKKASKKKVSDYSFGMRQRLGLAQALLNDPKLLILDEPTVGLDPVGTELMKTTLKNMSQKGVAVMFSSHELQAVEDICNRIVVIENGELIYDDSMDKLKSKEICIVTDNKPEELLCKYGEGVTVENCCVTIKDVKIIDEVISCIKDNGLMIMDISTKNNMLFQFFKGGTSK